MYTKKQNKSYYNNCQIAFDSFISDKDTDKDNYREFFF